jgi:hypothetical protein
MMNFAQVWLAGYASLGKFIGALKSSPAPQWGCYAQVLRSLMVSLLLYLPLAIMGRQPPTPSYLTFIPTENYYTTLIWLTPLVFMTEWLLGASVIHVFLRVRKMPSDIDQILNITGMASLVIATVLLGWDWLWFIISGTNQYILGISHLLIDVWWFVIVVTGLKQLAGIPVRLGIFLTLLAFATAMPLAILFMRAPF